jgi:hypothetical protein
MDKNSMPTERPHEIRTHVLFPLTESYVDTPKSTRFFHVSRTNGQSVLHTLVDPNTPTQWRKIKPIPSVDFARVDSKIGWWEFVGSVDLPDGRTILYMLDPVIYDHERKPVAT